MSVHAVQLVHLAIQPCRLLACRIFLTKANVQDHDAHAHDASVEYTLAGSKHDSAQHDHCLVSQGLLRCLQNDRAAGELLLGGPCLVKCHT